jgi:CubicO group peptidase (beta-lactamase class C family)
MRFVRAALALAVVSCFVAPAVTAAAGPAPAADPAYQKVLGSRVAAGAGLGIVVGVIDHGQSAIYTAGSTGNAVPLDDHTVFEIGSVTKTFTATILASMVRDGSVRLDDPVAKYLPATVHVPSRNGKVITLLNLATQHSGLPRLPSNLNAASSDPYAHYTKQNLYAFLNGYKLTRDPGKSFEYSNLGVGLLGVALANRAHLSYPALLRARVLAPLGMNDTSVEVVGSTPARMAAPHTMEGDPANTWHFDALAPAGGITSTAADMLKYLRCNMGEGPLAATCLFAQQPRDTIPGNHIGLVWWTGNTRHIIHHGGDTLGFHAAVEIAPDRTRGAIALVNGGMPVEDVAAHAFDPTIPVTADVPETNDPAVLDEYVGTYVHKDGTKYVVTRRGGQLYAKLAEQETVRVYTAGKDRFVYHVVDAQIDFTRDAHGKVNALVLNQGGKTAAFVRPGMTAPTTLPTAAPRAAAQAPASFPPAIQLDAATLDSYAGTYAVNDTLAFVVRRAGDGIEVQFTGQSFLPVYASAKDAFFYKVVDARFEFQRDASGAVTGLVFHQGASTLNAKRK